MPFLSEFSILFAVSRAIKMFGAFLNIRVLKKIQIENLDFNSSKILFFIMYFLLVEGLEVINPI